MKFAPDPMLEPEAGALMTAPWNNWAEAVEAADKVARVEARLRENFILDWWNAVACK